MGEWIIGAFINLFGSIAINFETNLLKLGHNEREMHSMLESDGTNGKLTLKPIIQRVGIIFFLLGNCLNFISFGYAAQSLLAALGSIQFVSNIAFAFFVLNKLVTVKILVATAFIVLGNIFLVAFGNHQSPGAVGSCSVLFAKSLSNLLRLALYSGYQLHGWFTYSMLLLFLSTAGFWIAWTFFSICTGFIYFQEYQVLDALRTTMFILGMMSVFVGISLLAHDETKGNLIMVANSNSNNRLTNC
ncbi:probable magnesium transporter NIPA8 [Corylus avellana]|uniref:probable magnesium transporter NIPA8 n=1 Tax=Corylus avellana TaxID=13451 RepID=UPI00286CC338|nr:probable magnesium transporter NIPA8 [Corylus avellana]